MKVIIELDVEESDYTFFRKEFYHFYEYSDVSMGLVKLNIDNRDVKIQDLRAEFAGTKRH